MAVENIPVTPIARNAGTVVATAGTINTTDGNQLVEGTFSDEVIIYVNNTGDAGTVSITPGDNPPSLVQSGTVEIAVGGTAARYFRLETGRVTQDDGTILLKFSSGMAGDVAAYDPIVRGL